MLWPWSSYRPTVGDSKALEWLAVAELLSEFSSNAATALNAFRQFVDAGVSAPAPWKELRQEIYLGDQSFIESVQARMLEARRTDCEIPRPQRAATPKLLSELFDHADDIRSAVFTAYRSGHFTMRQIADHLGVHYSTVSRLLIRREMLDCKT